MEENYKSNAPHRWRVTAENATGCQKGLSFEERDCHVCENLKLCLNYHEECLSAICNFIADLIEDGGGAMKEEMTKQIIKASEKAVFGEEIPKNKKHDEDFNYHL